MTRAEQILEQVYLEMGSPVEFAEDKTAWKKIALEAMKRVQNQYNKKCSYCGIDELFTDGICNVCGAKQ